MSNVIPFHSRLSSVIRKEKTLSNEGLAKRKTKRDFAIVCNFPVNTIKVNCANCYIGYQNIVLERRSLSDEQNLIVINN